MVTYQNDKEPILVSDTEPLLAGSKVNQRVPLSNDEASCIAMLIGSDGYTTVGLVYVWETSELSILWLNGDVDAAFVSPKICTKILINAKPETPEDVFALLDRLQELNASSIGVRKSIHKFGAK